MPSEEQINEIAQMKTPENKPDLEKQLTRLKEIREAEVEANTAAIKEQNEWAETNKIVWARPVAGSEFNDYDAYIHPQCSGNEPPGWDKLLINDTIRNKKCLGCGFTLGEPNGN